MRRRLTALALYLLASTLLAAQAAQPPQSPPPAVPPSSQQQAMGYFAGYWKITGTTRISPQSPPVAFTSTQHGEWVPGGYFLEIHAVTHGPLGDVHVVRMMEYNSADSVYTYNEYNSLGEHVLGIGRIEGKQWVWNTTKKMSGVATKGRYITTFVTADSYSFQSEVAKPGGGWATITEGTATRTPPPQP